MHPSKLIWGVRAIIYSLFFGKVDIPTYIGKPCFIEGRKHIYIGKKVRIFPGVRMEAINNGEIRIGNNVAIEQNVHITAMGSPKGGILEIGNDVTIAANTFITNLDHEYTDISRSVMDQGYILKDTKIGEGCFIGFGVSIQAGTKLGKHCVVGTNAVVRGEYPDYSVIVGNPARIVKRYNAECKLWERT